MKKLIGFDIYPPDSDEKPASEISKEFYFDASFVQIDLSS